MEAKLPDARPLINVCDRHDMVGDLTTYLYTNNLLRYIEGYVQKVSPQKTPDVVGALLDAEAPDDFVNALILSVRCAALGAGVSLEGAGGGGRGQGAGCRRFAVHRQEEDAARRCKALQPSDGRASALPQSTP